MIAVRWATIAIGLGLAAVDRADAARLVAWGVPLVVYAALRTFRPLRYRTDRVASLVMVLAEVALCLVVVAFTGYWDSPYTFCLAAAIIAAGFARGFGFSIRTAAAAAIAIALPYHLTRSPAPAHVTVQWSVELLLVALIAGWARRLFGEVEEQRLVARQANDLLTQLNVLARTLPASLDLGETAGATLARLRDAVPFDAAAILLRGDGTDPWAVAACEGVRLPALVPDEMLPPAAARAVGALTPVATETLHAADGPGLSGVASAGVYAPLLAGSRLVGLVAVEALDAAAFGHGDRATVGAVRAIADDAALALDNARWFSRLRTVGADEERTRIARELHDRIGQSLAFVAFELDRISRLASGGPVEAELGQLRDEVRRVVTEVRDALYDLRTDVSESRDLVATIAEFVERVGERTGIDASFTHAETRRLPLRQERELWRIAQEAVTNAARHGAPRSIRVSWHCDDREADLEVVDDGVGMEPGVTARSDAFGIVGMRERAAAIGGHLTIESPPPGGTVIRCRLALR